MTTAPIRLAGLVIDLLLGGGAAPEPSAYGVSGDGVVDASVETVPARIRVDPGAPSMPIVTKAFAARAGLKPGMFGIAFKVGPVPLRGETSVVDLEVGGIPFKRRTAWFDRAYASGLDGVVGPGGVPAAVIRFDIHSPRAGERTIALPMVDAGGLLGNWGGLFGEVRLGGEAIKVRFDLHHQHTLASAGMGQRIATAQGGALSGPVDQAEVVFGVVRPIRLMRLARPLAVGPLSLSSLHVRVTDYGSAATIPDADAVPDPEEIVVTGKKKRDTARDRLTIGLDQLDRCSSLVFDKPAKVIRLTCL